MPIALEDPTWMRTAAAVAGACGLVAIAEGDGRYSRSEESVQGEAKSEDEPGPYDNLPETDEPTDCILCNTFRHGPCRPLWRKFEACSKDKSQGDDSTRCMDYAMPFHNCFTLKYPNLYTVGMLETTANDTIRPLMAQFDENYKKEEGDKLEYESKTWSASDATHPSLTVDWSQWKQYVADNDWKPRGDADPTSCPLPDKDEDYENRRLWWLRLWEHEKKESEDLDVVHAPLMVPRMVASGEGTETAVQVLESFFVMDQNGHLIAFIELNWEEINEKAAKKEEEKHETTDEDDKTSTDENDPYKDDEIIRMTVVPASSVGVTIHAVYEKRTGKLDEQTKILYTTPPIPLAAVGANQKPRDE